MSRTKGPDLLELPREAWPESAWVPSTNLLEPYDWGHLFGNSRPVEVELGAGDGGFIREMARRHPERNFFAVERLLGRARKIARRVEGEPLPNLKVLRLESGYFLQRLCPPGSVRVLHIMFPDPWPKKRHHRRRLIQPEFLAHARACLAPGGELRFTTDHAEYFEWAMEQWRAAPGWVDGGAWDAAEDPRTDFERLFQAEGRTIHRRRWLGAG